MAVVEDNSRAAGVGSAVALALGDAEVDVPVRRFGIPEQFLAHAKRGEVLADIGLTPVEIAGRIGAGWQSRTSCQETGGSLVKRRGDHSRERYGTGKSIPGAGVRPRRAARRARSRALRAAHQVPEPPAPAHAAHHRLRQGVRAGRGRALLGRGRQRLPGHARRVRGDGPGPPSPRRPQGAARRPRRPARRPHPLRLPAAARAARGEAARAQPAPGPGVLRQQRYGGRRDRAEVRPVRHREAAGSCTARTPSTG